MDEETHRAYQLLGLKPWASFKKIAKAYKMKVTAGGDPEELEWAGEVVYQDYLAHTGKTETQGYIESRENFPWLQGRLRTTAEVVFGLTLFALFYWIERYVVFRESFVRSFPGAEIALILAGWGAMSLVSKLFKEDL